jgi:ZIP family zinc transporter
MSLEQVLFVSAGLGFIFIMTCFGASMVFFFRNGIPEKVSQAFLGFAAGVMIAAAIWGLLIPAIEEAAERGALAWLPISASFVLGILFLLGLDRVIPHIHPTSGTREGMKSGAKKSTLLLAAVTLHNIPEGMAIGLSFALASQNLDDPTVYASAIALAVGIGIHNFPEGAAITLPLRQDGLSSGKSFGLGCMSGAVEPFFGFIVMFFAAQLLPAMPWLLAFAAGAMLYVVVEELIPEANLGEHSHTGTLSVMAGFLLMLILEMVL